jgi:hypothetical protein
MPTVLRIGPYRFFFYSNEGHEPPHIHVESADGEASAGTGVLGRFDPREVVRDARFG